jgi:hypothetical protein
MRSAEEFAIEEHFGEFGRVLRHFFPAPAALGPDLGRERREFVLRPKTIAEVVPRNRLRLAGKLLFGLGNLLSEQLGSRAIFC